DSCWYSNDSGANNNSLADCQTNLSDITWPQGLWNITLWVNDSVGNQNSTGITFTIDSIPPYFDEIPIDQSLIYKTALNYNINASDSREFDCFAVNDTRFKINCTGSLENNSILGVMNYSINITINDTLNNINSTIISINITKASSVVYTYLNHQRANLTVNNDTDVWLNSSLSTGDMLNATCHLYNNETEINNGLSPLANETRFNTTKGKFNITTICDASQNYTVGNETWFVNITILPDTINPNVTINYPGNNSYNVSSIDFNVTSVDDIVVDSCWYSLNSGVDNNTMLNFISSVSDYNHTNISIIEGSYAAEFYCNDSSNNINNTESVSFVVDNTQPAVNLTSPLENSSYDSNALALTLNYNITDNYKVDNCTLIVNAVLNTTNTTINANVVNNFTEVFGPGIYNWSVNCTDNANNIGNGSVRNFTVTAVSVVTPPSTGGDTGGGGGGGGIFTKKDIRFEVYEEVIDVITVINAVKTKEIEVKNIGEDDINFRIKVDKLKNIIEFDKKDLMFSLKSGEKRVIKFRVVAPGEPGVYTGKILVNNKEVLVIVNVNSRELLFDAGIVIPDEFKRIDYGTNLAGQVTLIPMGEDPRVDVTLNYIIKDFNGRTFLTESETMLIEGQKTFKKDFSTANFQPGKYVLALELVYPNGVAVSSSHFEIVGEETFLSIFDYDLRLVFIVLGVAIIILIISIIFVIKRYKKVKIYKRTRKNIKNKKNIYNITKKKVKNK
ncbi:MAG: hypothetical protein ABIH37_03220, partial [archaeon]